MSLSSGIMLNDNMYFLSSPEDAHRTQVDELDLAIANLGNKVNTHIGVTAGDFTIPNINWAQ